MALWCKLNSRKNHMYESRAWVVILHPDSGCIGDDSRFLYAGGMVRPATTLHSIATGCGVFGVILTEKQNALGTAFLHG